jgi:hypothetical protein
MLSYDNNARWPTVVYDWKNNNVFYMVHTVDYGVGGYLVLKNSTNGIDWTVASNFSNIFTTTTNGLACRVRFLNGKFFAIGYGSTLNNVAISTDGINWSGRGVINSISFNIQNSNYNYIDRIEKLRFILSINDFSFF